jgi:hypothetical protein
MPDYQPSRVRILSNEAVSPNEVKITVEVIVDVNRLAQVGQEFISQAVKQMGTKPPRP